VTVVARRPDRLRGEIPGLTLVALDITTDVDGLTRTLAGHDVVLSTIGRGLSLRSGNLMRRSAPNIIVAMERAGVRRLVFTCAFGVAGTFRQAALPQRIIFRTALANIYADKAVADAAIRQSSLDWTILYPVRLTNRPATGRYVMGHELPAGSPGTLTRGDAALALLACVDAPETIRQGLVVSSARKDAYA
jgi:putative NADH-flavin reductase